MGGIFLLLGGNKLNRGILNKFQQAGYFVCVVDWGDNPDLIGDKHLKMDVKEADAIIEKLKLDNILNQVCFAYSSIDLAVPSVARINREIGLKTMNKEAVNNAVSKSCMARIWNEKGLLNRISKRYRNYADSVFEFCKKSKIIMKPDNSASSRGITVLEQGSSYSECWAAYEKAEIDASNGIVVVEEFIKGTEYTVEMIGDAYGNVCVYGISKKTHTENTDNNRIAIKLHYNCIDISEQNRIADYAIKCYKALGFTASLGHLEVLVKEDGTVSPIEIGARSSGFIASDLVDIVSGADFLGDLFNVQKGGQVRDGLHNQTDKSAVYYFYDFPKDSIVKSVHSILDFMDKRITSRYSDRSQIVKGHRFDKISNDNERIGYEILEGPKGLLTEGYLMDCEKRMLINTIKI